MTTSKTFWALFVNVSDNDAFTFLCAWGEKPTVAQLMEATRYGETAVPECPNNVCPITQQTNTAMTRRANLSRLLLQNAGVDLAGVTCGRFVLNEIAFGELHPVIRI